MSDVESIRRLIFPPFHFRILPQKFYLKKKEEVDTKFTNIGISFRDIVKVTNLVVGISWMPQRLRQRRSRPRVGIDKLWSKKGMKLYTERQRECSKTKGVVSNTMNCVLHISVYFFLFFWVFWTRRTTSANHLFPFGIRPAHIRVRIICR